MQKNLNEFKVRDKGLWYYKERELLIRHFFNPSPAQLESLIANILSFLNSQTRGGLIQQVAGDLDSKGSLVKLELSIPGIKDNESIEANVGIDTKFNSYEQIRLCNHLIQISDTTLFEGLGLFQVVRQLGFKFNAIHVSMKFYSSKSKISKWFRVPKEEGRILFIIDRGSLTTTISIGSSIEDAHRIFILNFMKLILSIISVPLSNLEELLDSSKPIQTV